MGKIIKVKSINQKGGMTVGNINLGGHTKTKNWQDSPLKYYLILVLIGITVSFFGYLFLKDKSMNIFNVSSSDQSGGITAGQVNLNMERPSRHMTDSFRNITKEKLPENMDALIHILAVNGNSEAFVFANEIKNYVISLGYTNVSGVDSIIYSSPVIGQTLDVSSDGVTTIVVGENR